MIAMSTNGPVASLGPDTSNNGPVASLGPDTDIGAPCPTLGGKSEEVNINPDLEDQDAPATNPTAVEDDDAPYSVFTEREKIMTILMVSFMGLVSPLSSTIYYPALDSIASNLHVSISLVNLTITTYMIFQGLAPSFIGNFSDSRGRRPAYLICFAVYLCANIGLALQNNYVALIILRCVQSSGSSGTITLGSAVVSDLTTRAERGKYIGYASMGLTLGPTLGPVIGGLLDTYLGWKSIFWFLVIYAGMMLVTMLIFLPETCRTIVGNGSIPPSKYNTSLLTHLQQRRQQKRGLPPKYDTAQAPSASRRRVNPLATLAIVRHKETFMILCFMAIHYAGYFAVLSTLSTQLASRYHLSSLKVGLCFIPIGVGTLTSRWTLSYLVDFNFRREAQKAGLEITKNKQQKIEHMDIEKARLTICLPTVYASCAVILAYAWVMQYRTPLAAPLVVLFFCGNLFSGVSTTLNVLVVDINRHSPATASAAMNLFRCLLGAGATAVANPAIEAMGIGWVGTMIAGIWVLFSGLLWVLWFRGFQWRKEKFELETAGDKAEKSVV